MKMTYSIFIVEVIIAATASALLFAGRPQYRWVQLGDTHMNLNLDLMHMKTTKLNSVVENYLSCQIFIRAKFWSAQNQVVLVLINRISSLRAFSWSSLKPLAT